MQRLTDVNDVVGMPGIALLGGDPEGGSELVQHLTVELGERSHESLRGRSLRPSEPLFGDLDRVVADSLERPDQN